MHAFREGIKELDKEELKKIKYTEMEAQIIWWQQEQTGTEEFGSYNKDWNNSYKVNRKIQEYENGKKQKKNIINKQMYLRKQQGKDQE